MFRKAVFTIFGCTLLYGALGASAGFAVGKWFPGYFRGILMIAREPGFDAVSYGFGQGLTHGIIGGAIVGGFVVLLPKWRMQMLRRRIDRLSHMDGVDATVWGMAHRCALIATAIIAMGSGVSIGWIYGLLAGEGEVTYRRYLEEYKSFAPLIAADPALAHLNIGERTEGGVYISGLVANAADMERLRSLAVRAVGEHRGNETLFGVGIRQ
ncbi:MAG: hypothetical protein JWN70_1840 [Planctomycetaceae bacterium]|nr:hypothetical protein [Planctomycetaceae bacterium]